MSVVKNLSFLRPLEFKIPRRPSGKKNSHTVAKGVAPPCHKDLMKLYWRDPAKQTKDRDDRLLADTIASLRTLFSRGIGYLLTTLKSSEILGPSKSW